MFWAVLGVIAVYVLIAVRTFMVCISGYTPGKDKEDDILPQVHIANPITRADIIDRNGAIIATTLPTVNLYAKPHKIRNKPEVAAKLSELIPDMLYEDILERLNTKKKFVYIKRNLSLAQKYQIYALGVEGLDFEKVEKRVYPHSNLFSHILGKTNIDDIGISGIEKEFNERLTTSDVPLQLSVDAGIQDTIREKLLSAINKFDALGGAAILMDVNTGEVLAMISLPDFDPNLNTTPEERTQFNFATLGLYEPGSVLKIFNAAMGLDSGKIKLTDKFDATKPLKLRYNTIKDYRGENRWLDLQEILIHSSNIGSAQIALKVGKEQQRKFLKNLGLFDTIKSFEVTEKAHPSLPRRWGEETTATVAYGYGISVTPLHLITAFSAVVNGGTYYKPTLIKLDEQPTGKKVMAQKTSMTMRKLLRGVVVKGSGKRANVPGYEVAGKTGTALKLVKGNYIDKKVMTSFLATFPVSNPKYALFLMMDEPKASKATFGFATSGWNTVPTAGEIITAIAPQLNIKANYDIDDKRSKMIEASYKR
ncbi:MAG: penicillin-binding protein 2 [Alphaproteobacteria bacterium]|nr:penicillin-binding protein 2 [Alphaproteobacteria bacterium]